MNNITYNHVYKTAVQRLNPAITKLADFEDLRTEYLNACDALDNKAAQTVALENEISRLKAALKSAPTVNAVPLANRSVEVEQLQSQLESMTAECIKWGRQCNVVIDQTDSLKAQIQQLESKLAQFKSNTEVPQVKKFDSLNELESDYKILLEGHAKLVQFLEECQTSPSPVKEVTICKGLTITVEVGLKYKLQEAQRNQKYLEEKLEKANKKIQGQQNVIESQSKTIKSLKENKDNSPSNVPADSQAGWFGGVGSYLWGANNSQ